MIVVLPVDPGPGVLEDLLREFQGRGWSCETSHGRSQTVLTVAGPDSARELESVLEARVQADVLPLQSSEHYASQRRRRSVLHVIAWGLWILIGLGLGVPAVAFLRSPVDELVGPEVVRAAQLDRVAPNSGRLVRMGREVVLLVRLDQARFFALSAICTHMDECQLEWSPERQQILCPCHGCAYDMYGNVVSGPPSIPLASFGVQVLGEEIFVRRGRSG